jgi:hypothetical protein
MQDVHAKLKPGTPWQKAALNKKTSLFIDILGLHLRKKLVTCYILSKALYGTETWTFWKVDQKHLEGFEMRCWRRMEKINWTDHVKNEDYTESRRKGIPYVK